jgi:hypothetical protein
MPTRWIVIGLLLLALGSAPGPVAADESPRPISGTVTLVRPELRTVQVGAETFHVPDGVKGLEALAPGVTVLIYYERVEDRSVVTAIETRLPE